MNTATQSTTKVSLAFLFFGRHLEPIKSLRRNCEDREQVVQIKEKDWLEPEELRDLVCKHTNDDLDIQKNRFNKWRKDVPYFVSDIYFPFISLRKGWTNLTDRDLGPQQGDDLLQMETNEVEMGDPVGVMGPQLNPPRGPGESLGRFRERDIWNISSIDEIINAPNGAMKKEEKNKEESKVKRR